LTCRQASTISFLDAYLSFEVLLSSSFVLSFCCLPLEANCAELGVDIMKENPSRQYPAKNSPWVMKQIWHDLLFAHWPVAPELLKGLVPDALPLDMYRAKAWVGVVPFWMSGVRPRFFPAIPWFSTFPELNVRTYVTVDGKPGVYFFSLDATRRIAVEGARRLFSLPYFTARMSASWHSGWFVYQSERIYQGSPDAQLSMHYRPTASRIPFKKGSIEDFLTSRYCLYTVDSKGHAYRQEIDHPAWSLQPAEAKISVNTMAEPMGVPPEEAPAFLHFAKRQEVTVWLPERIL
jgi:uncharacterized protein YqjF (DUF2071 family)